LKKRLKILSKISANETAEIFRTAKNNNLIDEWDSSVIFYSFDILEERLNHLNEVFPSNTFHAIAIKTNPLHALLKFLVKSGFGLEAASLEELLMARQAGIASTKAVFDSPVKRRIEINICSSDFKGMILNANTIDELEIIQQHPDLNVGLRINPLIETGAPAVFDVSGYRSKFGVPMDQSRMIIDACIQYPFIKGLHMHSGSEISHAHKNAEAIGQLKHLADEINGERSEQGISTVIEFIDIGGGIPADYSEEQQPGLNDYVSEIRNECPDLFNSYRIITEFGHFIHAHASWVISDVEYILDYGNHKQATALVHIGADMFVRQAYSTNQKNYRITVLDKNDQIKDHDKKNYDIAGPLCFSGDYLFRDVSLPVLEKHNKIIIHDVGANTYALWSKHCNRDFPKVIGYSKKSGEISIIQKRHSWHLE